MHKLPFRFRYVVAFAACVGVREAVALQGWINKGSGSMNSTANWSGGVLPTTSASSANSAWCFWFAHTNPTTLTLDSDLVTDRLVIDQDKSGADATFDLGVARALTFKGTTGYGIRVHRANDVKLRLKSGKIVIDSDAEENNKLYFPSSSNNETTGKQGQGNRFLVTGANSELTVPAFNLTYGQDNALVVTNGASLKTDLVFAHANSAGNKVLFSGTGTKFVNTRSDGVVTAGDHSGASGCTFEINDGATIENFKTLKIGGKKTLFAVRGASTVLATTGSRSTFGCSGGGENRFEVTDGASFTLGGSDGRFWMGTTGNTPSNVVWVSGSGSKFVAESTSNHIMANGSGSGGQRFVVTAGASATLAGSLRIGGGTGNGNIFRVDSGATATFGNLYVGHGENGTNSGNTLEIVGTGSSAETSGDLILGFKEASAQNRMRIDDGASLTVGGSLTIGDNGGGNCACVSRGATLTAKGGNNKDMRVGAACSDNALLVDGGTVTWPNGLYTGADDNVSPGTNAVAVVNGGSLTLGGTFFLYGADNVLSLTNGVLAAIKVQLPYFNDSDGMPTITLAGTNPVIRSATTLQIRRGAKVVFAPTGKGYVQPALQADDLQLIDGANPAQVCFDVSGLDIEPGTSIILAKGMTQLQFQPNAWAAAQAHVPEGYKLILSDNELSLYRKTGMAIIIR